jgi:hypothetical protein
LYQDYYGDSGRGGQAKARNFCAQFGHISVGLVAIAREAVFGEVEPVINSIYKSIEVSPVDRAKMQQVTGDWQGVPVNPSGYNAGVSTEHLMTLYPDGSCSSNDFVAVSSSTDGTSPMAGYDEHRISGTASGSFQGKGRYFVTGNVLIVVEPDGSYYPYNCSEAGVLVGTSLKWIRN